MKVGDQVRCIRHQDTGLVVGEVQQGKYFLVEYDQNIGNKSRFTAAQVKTVKTTATPSTFFSLKLDKFYYWHIPTEVQVIGKPTVAYVPALGLRRDASDQMIQPICKMVSGCRCAKCNDFNEYVEVPETQVKSWICTPCKS